MGSRIDSILNHGLLRVCSLSYRFPWAVVLFSFALALYGGYLYGYRLKLVSDRGSLVNKDSIWNRRAGEYEAQFGKDEFLILVVSPRKSWDGKIPLLPDDKQRRAMKRIVREWTGALSRRPDLFPSVTGRVDPDQFGDTALLYLPSPQLRELIDAIHHHSTAFRELSGSVSLSRLIPTFRLQLVEQGNERSAGSAEQVRVLLEVVNTFLGVVRNELNRTDAESAAAGGIETQMRTAWPAGAYDPDGYLFTSDGRLITAFATVKNHPELENEMEPAMLYANHALDSILKTENADVGAGITGMPALEYDEMQTSKGDFERSTLITAGLLLILFVIGYRSVIRPAIAILCIGIAIGMTFVFVYFTIGHLNMLAMVFTVMLVSIGTDYSIIFMTFHMRALQQSGSLEEAVDHTVAGVGRAVLAGGATGAVAFFSADLTEFTGLGELGIVAGAGLLLSVVCALIVYPAIMVLIDRGVPRLRARIPEEKKSPLMAMAAPSRSMSLAIIAVLAPAAIAGYVSGQYSFDTSLLNLQSDKGSAYLWERRLLQVDDRATFAISTFKSRAELEEMREKFDANPSVFRATEALFPDHEGERRAWLKSAEPDLQTLSFAPPAGSSISDFKRELYGLRQEIRSYRMKSREADIALAPLADSIDSLYKTLISLPPDTAQQRLERIETDLYKLAERGLARLHGLFNPPVLDEKRLPDVLRSRFLGKDGTYALMVYPAKDAWETQNLNEFIEAARRVDPNVFGGLVTFYENGHSLIRSFLESALAALAAIPLIILLLTRSPRTTILSCIPLVAGIGLLLGAMHLLQIRWNFANFFALPILIGSGVDYGVYLVHAYERRDGSGVNQAIVRATWYTAMTTIIGFGVLSFSQHRGIASLGVILFLGTALCLATTLTLLPAIITLLGRRKG